MRAAYISVLVLALVGAAIASEPPTCKDQVVPGIMTIKEKNCSANKNCSQCCNEYCEIETCNNCDEDCPERKCQKPKVWEFYVDVTCNIDDYWNVECIVCDCPADKWEWDYVAEVLQEKLKWELLESNHCKMAKMINSFKLSCGISTKKWDSNGDAAAVDTATSPVTWPWGFPFQCKNENWKCIFTDRSFPGVHIKIQKKCKLFPGAKCISKFKKTDTACEYCDKENDASWIRFGKVISIHKYCENKDGYCKKLKPDIWVRIPKCTEICLHADFGESCDYCTDIWGAKTKRTPPLCVPKDLNPALYKNNCGGGH
ncbi:hypothetical protein NDN08_002084 [Rhodosorus marinus]|uniref:Uncharacterized protein n=1 Tax=Rhodosorus marinus TaxID=101924 RepID=A0AAV8UX46_9RHOD|nr:hypothetical protein NDN08_002084 [Rhodosorus marinus]